MMCWESLDESEPTSKKRKTLPQGEALNDQADEIGNDPHNQHTANKGIGSLIPINDLQLGADDDASTLATQETSAKNLVYITNIPDGKLDYTKNARDSSKNSGEQDGKPSSLLEKPDQLIRKDTLNAYENLIRMIKGRRAKNAQRIPGEHVKLHIWNSSQMMTWQNC